MSYGQRLAICAAASVAAHVLVARATANMRPRTAAPPPVVLRVEVREPPPPAPEPEPAPTPERPPVHEAPARRAPRLTASRPTQAVPPPKAAAPTERPATDPNQATANPVFGISMESTSAAGSGPSMAVGNTLQTRPRKPGEEVEPSAAGQRLVAPVPAYEVTKMPLPKGECTGQYTSEAREQGLEGVVVFDLVVDEQGRVRDIKVVQGLPAGLTEAAKRALGACQFTPGERDGKPVPVRIRSFKIRFTLRENE